MSTSSAFPALTLRALLDRLIPRDGFPGAVEAGGEDYVLGQLNGDCASEAASLAAGLICLDAEAHARFANVNFASLTSDRQDALLKDLESGRAVTPWPAGLPTTAFLARMIDLAHEGFYADPSNGGNREAASWRMIGYETRLRPAGTLSSRTTAPSSSDLSKRIGPHGDSVRIE